MPQSGAITHFLSHLDPEDPDSYNQLWSLMYDELLKLAHKELYRWRPGKGGQALSTRSLVHKCYLKLCAAEQIKWENREHFYRGARQAMRQLVIDFARARSRNKRGDGAPHISIEDATLLIPVEEDADELLNFDEALEHYGQMGELGKRGKQVVEYVYFMGLTRKETAELLGVATKTVKRDFDHFKAWYAQHYAPA